MAAVDPRDDPASVIAANQVLLELWTILAGFADALTIVGGSAPPFLTGDRPEDPYGGTLDVDVVIDPIGVPDDVYRTIAELLRDRGYVQLDQPFRWLRSVTVDGRSIDVEVDLLAPVTPRSGTGHRHERIGGEPLARRTEGAELVRTAHVERDLAGVLPDGRQNRVVVRVATPGALVILKALAMGQRDKPKDAYDVDYLLRHIGVEEVAAEITAFGRIEPIERPWRSSPRSSPRSIRSDQRASHSIVDLRLVVQTPTNSRQPPMRVSIALLTSCQRPELEGGKPHEGVVGRA